MKNSNPQPLANGFRTSVDHVNNHPKARKLALVLFFAIYGVFFAGNVSAGCFGIGGRLFPDLTISENESTARVALHRSKPISEIETVNYFTPDQLPDGFLSTAAAKAGVHYTAVRRTAVFPVGVDSVQIDIPIIDNGLLDGPKEFALFIGELNQEGFPENSVWIRIEDNELGVTVDPMFVPEAGSADHLPLRDGGVLVSTYQNGLTRLNSAGVTDAHFNLQDKSGFPLSAQSEGTINSTFTPLHELKDGRIVALHSYFAGPSANSYLKSDLLRFSPSGQLDAQLISSNFTGFATVQADEKILAILEGSSGGSFILRRLNPDGSLDAGFAEGVLKTESPYPVVPVFSFAAQRDGKILLNGNFDRFNNAVCPGLVRLNTDGSLDTGFVPPTPPAGWLRLYDLLLRRNGKLIVHNGDAIVQLNENGSIDRDFQLARAATGPSIELPSGEMLGITSSWSGIDYMVRWNPDGTLNPTVPQIRGPTGTCGDGRVTLSMTLDGQVLVAGRISGMDGFPRRGLARFRLDRPGFDFRVMTPSECSRSSGVARIQVVRTGPTTSAASISFATRDATAKAGTDYAPQSGTLSFEPLEVSKEVVVPLLATTPIEQRLTFNLEFSNPSPSYITIPSTPVSIRPDLRIATESLHPRADGSVALTLLGTLPGYAYVLEVSPDLMTWIYTGASQATGPATVFDPVLGYDPHSNTTVWPVRGIPQFFRARRE